MSKRQETADDIIAEMLGARTEFPFVYLMGEPDTPEVIDFKTKEIVWYSLSFPIATTATSLRVSVLVKDPVLFSPEALCIKLSHRMHHYP